MGRAALGLLIAAAWATPAAATTTYGTVRSVFPPGEGQNLDAPDALANFTGAESPPTTFSNQVALFTGLLYAAPTLTDADLPRFFKPADIGVPPGEAASVAQPRAGVTITRDAYGVAHVHGTTRPDVMFGSGYVQAADRLWTLENFRSAARGRLAELRGPSEIADDRIFMRVSGLQESDFRRQFESLRSRYGAEGALLQSDVRAYVDGINAYLAEARLDPRKRAGELDVYGRDPAPWTVTDVVAVNAMAQSGVDFADFVPQYDVAQLRAAFERRLGRAAGDAEFAAFQSADDPETPTTLARRFPMQDLGSPDPRAVAVPDPGSVEDYDPVVAGGPAPAGRPALWKGLTASRSNALVVGAEHAEGGHPLADWGPQGGITVPNVFFNEVALDGPGVHVRGISDTGTGPWVSTAGRGVDFSWSNIDEYGDQIATFAERLCEPDGSAATRDSRHYLHDGRCVAFAVTRVRETVTPKVADTGNPGDSPRTYVLEGLRSVHGPVAATGTVGGRPVAFTLARTSLRNSLGTWVVCSRLNSSVNDAGSFVDAVEHETSQTSWFYADDRDIAFAAGGKQPTRAKGTSYDAPAWGTGEWDWHGLQPDGRRPHAIDPPGGLLMSWNSKAAPGWRPVSGKFTWGQVERGQLFSEPVRTAVAAGSKVGLADVVRMHELAATADLRGMKVYPEIRRMLGAIDDPKAAPLVTALDAWVADGSQRRDLDRDGVYEHGGAVALMDAWWEPLVRGIFDPMLGSDLVDHVTEFNPFVTLPSESHGWNHGWYGYVLGDLRAPRYCGGGDRSRCRSILLETLEKAAGDVRAQQGGDVATWTVPATCPGRYDDLPVLSLATDHPSCDQISMSGSGAAHLDHVPGQNRPSFEQVVEITGHRPR